MDTLPPQLVAYGDAPEQRGDLYLPSTAPTATVILLHGGFWRAPYGREQCAPLAAALCGRGFAVWNLGYRRIGADGGWPATLDDAVAGVEHAAGLPGLAGPRFVVGHSAGGQLALTAAAEARIPLAGVVALAALVDLAAAEGPGAAAVAGLLGGSPAEVPARCHRASPIARLPLPVPRLLVHGVDDDLVPVTQSRRYATAARAVGDPVTLLELPDLDHMACIAPASSATAAWLAWVATRLGAAPSPR